MPLAPEYIAQAAIELIVRRSKAMAGPRLPEHCRPLDLEDGWQVQQEVSRRLALTTAGDIGGWKAALPGPGKLVVAPIYAPGISQQAATVSRPDAASVTVEPEIAYVLARGLPARPQAYSEAEVDAAVGSVHAALEICASRYLSHADLPFPELLADGLVNDGLWLGPALTAAETPAFALSWQVEGEPVQQVQARHPNGQPRAPLYWLANFLRERGLGLQAGQIVITGSYAGVLELPLQRRVRFDYGALARFALSFDAARQP